MPRGSSRGLGNGRLQHKPRCPWDGKGIERQRALSEFFIFRPLFWLQVCARSKGCWEGQLEEGGGAE